MTRNLFAEEFRLEKIDKNGDPLDLLNKAVDWEMFRPLIRQFRLKKRKSKAGAKGYDPLMMFKILVLQSLYNLSDDAMEACILDRLTFMRFLDISLSGKVPDAKTIWLFRQQLTDAGIIDDLFQRFDEHLRANGFAARKGQIIDASIVEIPRQRNSRDENKQIKNGDVPKDWSEPKRRQKDVDARWVKKNGKNYYGYKNHIEVDVKHKFIRSWAATSAKEHDSQIFETLLDENNSSRDVWADSAYRSSDNLKILDGVFREHLQRKSCRHRKLTNWEKQGNRTRSRTRSRVEHIFGVQSKKGGGLFSRAVGFLRTRVVIGLRNLTFNLHRYSTLLLTS